VELGPRIEDVWERSIVPTLLDYIRIPALSPAFDPDWSAHGHLGRAVALLRGWAEARGIDGASVEVIELILCQLTIGEAIEERRGRENVPKNFNLERLRPKDTAAEA